MLAVLLSFSLFIAIPILITIVPRLVRKRETAPEEKKAKPNL